MDLQEAQLTRIDYALGEAAMLFAPQE